jgi:hypothetical protein
MFIAQGSGASPGGRPAFIRRYIFRIGMCIVIIDRLLGLLKHSPCGGLVALLPDADRTSDISPRSCSRQRLRRGKEFLKIPIQDQNSATQLLVGQFF